MLGRFAMGTAAAGATFAAARQAAAHEGGRIDAVEFTQQFEAGTLGNLIFHTVKPWKLAFGDIASGDIGLHYKAREEFLRQPATGPNIRELAKTETAWWNEQKGLPGVVGSAMSAETREEMLNQKKTCLLRGGEWKTEPKT